MKIKEIREKETSHLKHELIEKQKHLFDLRSQAVTEKLEDPSQFGKTRKDDRPDQDDPAAAASWKRQKKTASG